MISGLSARGHGPAAPRILLVDDDRGLLIPLAEQLRLDGFEVTTARDGDEALRRLDTAWPDLLIIDLMMPRMDGLTLAKTLKGDPNVGNIPLVMLTAKSGPMDMITGINAGARHYVTKPFKAADLIDKVKKALNKHR